MGNYCYCVPRLCLENWPDCLLKRPLHSYKEEDVVFFLTDFFRTSRYVRNHYLENFYTLAGDNPKKLKNIQLISTIHDKILNISESNNDHKTRLELLEDSKFRLREFVRTILKRHVIRENFTNDLLLENIKLVDKKEELKKRFRLPMRRRRRSVQMRVESMNLSPRKKSVNRKSPITPRTNRDTQLGRRAESFGGFSNLKIDHTEIEATMNHEYGGSIKLQIAEVKYPDCFVEKTLDDYNIDDKVEFLKTFFSFKFDDRAQFLRNYRDRTGDIEMKKIAKMVEIHEDVFPASLYDTSKNDGSDFLEREKRTRRDMLVASQFNMINFLGKMMPRHLKGEVFITELLRENRQFRKDNQCLSAKTPPKRKEDLVYFKFMSPPKSDDPKSTDNQKLSQFKFNVTNVV